MTAIVFVNNVNTTLAAATSSTGTSFTLASSSNLPVLAAGQIMPLTLNDAATGLIYEVVYVTGISGSVLTVERAQEGTTAQNWNVGDYAYSTNTALTTQPQRLVYEPTAGGTLPAGNGVVVIPTLSAAATFTLPSTGLNVGESGVIFGNGSYAVTVQTDVTTGSPAMYGPDNVAIYSYTLPAGDDGGGLRWVWDGFNFRYTTFGPTVVANAVANNQAVALEQVLNGSLSPTFDNVTASTQTVDGILTISMLGGDGGMLKLADTTSGQTTPIKYIRSGGGQLQVINSAYSATILSLDDSGDLSVAGTASVAASTASNQAPQSGQVVGIGQSLVSFAGALNTTYTNTGTKPIIVYGITTNSNSHTCIGYINGTGISYSSAPNDYASVILFVLPGETWEISDSVSSSTLVSIYIQE